ncbi:hypothetical protein L9F63_016228 [Diploptera punctata]|uniref:Uncharacterized protein n=1 Tax=Diploptera punctata TaxID=6984 RepID=A0AAD8EIE9_DIPPU|nr:hypothetical protein L9F63_016228 [Diploptera punctata]
MADPPNDGRDRVMDLKKEGCGNILQSPSLNRFSADVSKNSIATRDNEVEASDTYMQPTLYGRHAAHKPPSTIGKILQNSG